MAPTLNVMTVEDGEYWLRWDDLPEDEDLDEEEYDDAKKALRDRGLRLCSDDEGLLVTNIEGID